MSCRHKSSLVLTMSLGWWNPCRDRFHIKEVSSEVLKSFFILAAEVYLFLPMLLYGISCSLESLDFDNISAIEVCKKLLKLDIILKSWVLDINSDGALRLHRWCLSLRGLCDEVWRDGLSLRVFRLCLFMILSIMLHLFKSSFVRCVELFESWWLKRFHLWKVRLWLPVLLFSIGVNRTELRTAVLDSSFVHGFPSGIVWS